MRIGRRLAMAALLAAALPAQWTAEALRAPVKLVSPNQDKVFYLLSLLDRTPGARAAVKNDHVLAVITARRLAALEDATKTCKIELECYARAVRWTDDESAAAGHALAGLYHSSPAVRTLTSTLMTSGMYVRYNQLGGEAFLERAWTDCTNGLNHAIDVYGLGKPPRYPAIDSITYDVKAALYPQVVRNLAAMLDEDRAHLDLFFSASLRFAMELMLLNHRDEAGRYEPMESGENAAVFRRMKSVRWSQYPYSVIVVPGSGNDRTGVRLSPSGILRDEIAARRFHDGKAPFLLVSGGFVHPPQTEYAEAVEMKKDLVTRLGIPADAILIDPHARHTTTNMRNAARLMYRYGMPFDKKALVTTDLSQSQSIEGPAFQKRCMTELGYLPYKILGRISPFDLEFLPTVQSLHSDPLDPLDP